MGYEARGGEDFSRAPPWLEWPRNGARVLWPMRKAGLVMGESVTFLLFLRNRLSPAPFAFSRLNPKAPRLDSLDSAGLPKTGIHFSAILLRAVDRTSSEDDSTAIVRWLILIR
jgi:hypothetical protein